MEGPTPVSALIHAATMVTVGVFFIIRLSPLYEQLPLLLLMIVIFGGITSFSAGLIGVFQNDIKKIIAYSTCSQLGYMFLCCGFSYYNISLFHVINHGFFKALLFLSSGSIIHTYLDEQDSRKVNNIYYSNKLTYTCLFIGSVALMGLPFLSGYYSKDLILELGYSKNIYIFSLFLAITGCLITSIYSYKLLFYISSPYNSIVPLSFSSSFSLNTSTNDSHFSYSLPILCLLSIISGFILFNFICKPSAPILIFLNYKLTPFFLTIIPLIFFPFFSFSIKSIPLLILNFFSIKLFYDNIINQFILKRLFFNFYSIFYKFSDLQLLEKWAGPTRFIAKNKR